MVDPASMNAAIVWFGIGMSVCGGFVWGHTVGPPGASAPLGALWFGGLLAAGGAVLGGGRLRWRLGLCAIVGLGLARGLAVGAEIRDPGATTLRGLPGTSLRELEVQGAPRPGAMCEVSVRGIGPGPAMLLVDPGECRGLGHGDRIRVLERELAPTADLPGDRTSRQPRIHVERVWRVSPASDGYFAQVAALRTRAFEVTRGDEGAAFVAASTLGLRRALAPDTRGSLRRAGLGHLIAVSGMHVGVAALLVRGLALRLGLMLTGSVILGAGLSMVPVIAYVGLTGASPSAVRAAAMYGALQLGVAAGRPVHGLVSLMMVAAGLLWLDPAWSVDPGFQLSMVAMAAVVRAPAETGLLGHSWRVSWAVLAVSLWHFGTAPLHGLIANAVAIPVFSTWVLPLGFAGFAAGEHGSWLVDLAGWGGALILDVAELLADLPAVGLVGGAAASMVALVVRGVWQPGWAPRLRGWIPPWPAALAVIGVAGAAWLAPSQSPQVGAYRMGGRRVSTAFEVRDGGDACLVAPNMTAGRVASALEGLGARARTIQLPDDAAVEGVPPHLAELRRRLSGPGEPVAFGPCGPGLAGSLVEALRACLRRTGRRQGMVRRTPDGKVACFVNHAFRPLAAGEVAS